MEPKERKEKINKNLMKAIKAVHSITMGEDIDKTRQSQDNIGSILGVNKELTYEKMEIDGIDVEWISVNRPHIKKYIILYCHGGGYMTGSIKYARTITTKLAEKTSMDVVCFEYRLAPEHSYPAPLEDALKIWDFLMYKGYGASDIIIAGDSAGGNLALTLCHKLRMQGRMLPRGIILFSPWTNLTLSGKSYESKKELDPVLEIDYLRLAVKSYVKGKEDLENPLISPLFGDFKNFPPTLIQVGSNEILLNDSTQLNKNITNDNSLSKIEVYRGMWHVFQMSSFKKAYEAIDKAAEFIYDVCR